MCGWLSQGLNTGQGFEHGVRECVCVCLGVCEREREKGVCVIILKVTYIAGTVSQMLRLKGRGWEKQIGHWTVVMVAKQDVLSGDWISYPDRAGPVTQRESPLQRDMSPCTHTHTHAHTRTHPHTHTLTRTMEIMHLSFKTVCELWRTAVVVVSLAS